jgi:hypothetical protein
MSNDHIIWDEVNRIEAGKAQGEQSIMVQLEMKAWAVKNNVWGWNDHKVVDYRDNIEAHAEARGWKQSDVDGMELVY